jgi:hypothetical protein
MTTTSQRLSWSARLLIGLTLVLIGAAAAVWALAHYDKAAQFVGVAPPPAPVPPLKLTEQPSSPTPASADSARIAQLEQRLARLEQNSQQAQGSAGRADALVVAFAARRAIDRGVPLGFLENLLVDRFADQHRQAVATVITASRNPVRLDELRADYEKLGPELRAGGPNDTWVSGLRRQFSSLVEIRRANVPSGRPNARYQRAVDRLASGDVDSALAETMRLPGAGRAQDWILKARRYIAAHRALDEIESAALLVGATAR